MTQRYFAFLSYSHTDASWGAWLHKSLERYRMHPNLVGRETDRGTIPKAMRPIFRDRNDFTAGQSLSEATKAALAASGALIVVCSEHAAKSDYVNQEIRLFRDMHPDRPIIPVLVGGEFPNNVPRELRDLIVDQETLAADLRKDADGKALGLAKVVAGLLGVGTDEIVRRQEARKQRVLVASCVTLAFLVAGFAGLAYWAESNRKIAVAQRECAEKTARLNIDTTALMVSELAADT